MTYWEYGGTYERALKGTNEVLQVMGDDPALRTLLKTLSMAHVATLDKDQFQALPDEVDDLDEFVCDPHLPFNPLYISINVRRMAGILLVSTTGGIMEGFGDPDPIMGAVTFWDMETSRVAVPVGLIHLSARSYTDLISTWIHERDSDFDPNTEELMTVRMGQVLGVTKVVRFLQSANVDLGDTPVSRQVRRQAQRKNYKIASRVYVRSPQSRSHSNSKGTGAHIEFTHRFEVRGHYKHYGPDTRLFKATDRDRPDKIINHPTRGQVVRIWCPDYVKGPDDKPLVPKTRVYKKDK